ncbi:hypothetical protein B0I33_108315 [Prauserella shujinwangii]|uniref:Nudix hydrolase domain-containing protein n=1 Tax=Prauserella shujinwangii TaxID=1453103 RepID=A0A2T0LRQ8_9PSEU|nr:NUDIX domain-containing protein [Prauserella shujinwangii]PRX46168.1 hypothetical protein B0I33_108315 [Prauserella shujinwangii]
MTALLVVLGVVAAVVVLGGLWLVATANRLDRLHVRMDAGWAALDSALARRAVVARTVAASVLPGEEGEALRAAAAGAESAPRPERELAENELTRLLAELDRGGLPGPLADELTDAEERVVIARRVYNDAVRDALALRRRRRVRYFRLAGRARQPEYFEIAEPDLTTAASRPTPVTTARVLLVDEAGRVLLFQARDVGTVESFWLPVGGVAAEGEDLRTAAVRALRAETAVEPDPGELVGPVWRRRVRYSSEGRPYEGDEWYFLTELDGARPRIDPAAFAEPGVSSVGDHRWWSAAELRDCAEPVYPLQLGELLPGLLAAGWDGRLRSVR